MKRLRKYPLVLLIALFGCSINYQAEMIKPDSLMVMNGWVRLTPPVVKNTAAYFMLHNSSDKDVTVVDVQTSIAEKASMHDVLIEKSMAQMIHLDKLLIPAGKMVEFKPGGKHLMLINLTDKLHAEQEVVVTFILENGEKINANMKVKSQGNSQSSQHQHEH